MPKVKSKLDLTSAANLDAGGDGKYKQFKRKLKTVIAQNETLSLQLQKYRKRIHLLKREKNLLLDRISKWEHDEEDLSGTDASTDTTLSQSESEAEQATSYKVPSTPQKKNLPSNAINVPATVTPSVPSTQPAPVATTKKAPSKPKRVKRKELPVRRVQQVPSDNTGNIILPVQIGILTVYDLGHIVYERENFHNDRYIWPVGYKISRSYFSMSDPDKQTVYTCRVSDGGDGPRFHVEPEDSPENQIVANTPTGAWTNVIRVANAIRKRDHSNSASGPDYFGFSHPTVAKLIQDLPNAEKCKNYQWQKFELMTVGRATRKPRASSSSTHSKKEGDISSVGNTPTRSLSLDHGPDMEVEDERADVSESGEHGEDIVVDEQPNAKEGVHFSVVETPRDHATPELTEDSGISSDSSSVEDPMEVN